jgi:hypothetical protein
MSLPNGGNSPRGGGGVAWADPMADNTAAIIWRSLCDRVVKVPPSMVWSARICDGATFRRSVSDSSLNLHSSKTDGVAIFDAAPSCEHH